MTEIQPNPLGNLLGNPPITPGSFEDLEREATRWMAVLAQADSAHRDALAARLAAVDRCIADGTVRRIEEIAVMLRRAWDRLGVQAADPLGRDLLRNASTALERFATAADITLAVYWRGFLSHDAAEWPDEETDPDGWQGASNIHADLARTIAARPVTGPAGMLIKLMMLKWATVVGETGFEGLAAGTLIDAVLRLPWPCPETASPEEVPCLSSARSW